MKVIVYLLVTISVLLSFQSMAAIETYTNRISGSSIATNAQFTAFDGQFATMYTNPTWNTQFSNYQIKNKLQLGINPAVLQNNTLPLGGVTVEIKTWIWNTSTLVFDVATTSSITLAVDYSLTETNLINELSTYSFTGASKFDVKITSVNGGVSFDVNDVYLEASVEVERYYSFNGVAPSSVSATRSTNFIDFEWSQVSGAEFYELEYVHINDYKVDNNTSFLAASQLKYDFYKNSTRVIINTPYYRIPNVLDHGYLVYRVRAIGLVGSAFTIRKEGVWNLQESGLVSTLSLNNNYIPINFSNPLTPAYDYGMNWGYQATIADDGKRFEGITYADGLGRTRQTIANNAETNQIVVSNGYYDGYGRPTISPLPTPVDEQSLAHRVNFNKAEGGTYYGAAHIDQLYIVNDPNCSFVTTPFSTLDGTGKYFSPNNPDKDAENARIPDAQKYPFSRVEYLDDQTGRIRRVGGIGPDFQIGSGKETEFYYGIPTQYELDRLFGSEVGYNKHYQKRVTIDANGQAYVEYFDMAGRVIATGLQGEKPASLDQLANNTVSNETQVITYGINEQQVTPTSMTLSQPLILTHNFDYVFDYSLDPSHYENTSCLANICFDCVYKLTIKITDAECGTEKYNQSFTINGATYDAACNGLGTFNSNPTIQLTKGVYNITKTLEVDQFAIDQYWCTYVDNNTCIEDYADQFNELYNAADFSSCDNVIDYSVEDDDCSAITPFLLGDVSPGGQYATYTVTGATYISTDPISVLNTSNTAYSGHHWKNPYSDYKDENNVIDYVEVELVSPGVYNPPVSGTTPILVSGNIYKVKPQYLVNLKDFVDRFQDKWAESLLEAHPEYCYYEFCIQNSGINGSLEYDNAMESISSFTQARDLGFFKPLGVLTYHIPCGPPYTGPYNGAATNLDPFFQGPGSSYAAAAQAQMNNYITIDGYSMSMWSYAVLLAECPNANTRAAIDACICKTPCSYDAVWLKFRELYLDMKQSYYLQAEEDYVNNPANNCNVYADEVGEAGNPFANSTPRFDYYIDQLNGTPPNSATVGSINAAAGATCQTVSTEYVEQWLYSLSDCPTLPAVGTTAYDNLKADLIAFCSYGCSADHPAVASTLPGVISPSPLALLGGNIYAGATINTVLALYGISETELCSELLISEPGPYQVNLAENIYLDNCGCDLLLATNQQWLSNTNIPPGVTTIEALLAYNTGISLEDAEGLICHCKNQAGDWTPSYSWSSGQIENLLALQEIVPYELTCQTPCLDCSQVGLGIEELIARFGAEVINDPNYSVLLTNYLNNQYNFDLTYSHYSEFLMQCAGTETNPYCSPTEELFDFAEVMNLIANRGQLLTSSSSPLDLVNQNIVFKKSELRSLTNFTHYSAVVTGNQLAITFRIGETVSTCSTILNIPSEAGFTFADIIGFGQIIPTNGTCSLNSGTFSIALRYLDCGEIKTTTITGSTDCFAVQNCYCNFSGSLCNIPLSEQLANQQPCYEPILSQLYQQAEVNYDELIDEAKTTFITDYNSQCDDAFSTELYTIYGPFNRYQYTLFYYDQAGNLAKTVAPKGVTLVPNTQMAAVENSRNNTTSIDNQALPSLPPNQAFKTEYAFNSYNQAVTTSNPDQEDPTNFWYDRYGRIVASQNPVQADINMYSYIFYDNQGRPIETGQVAKSGGLSESVVKANDLGVSFVNWVISVPRTEVTFTRYDDYLSTAISSKFAAGNQQNLRLRVASALYYNTVSNTTNYLTDYANAIHYSYDLHGNVIEALQDVPMTELVQVGQDLKSTQYSFELLSGNVKKVEYQKGKRDRMTHEYLYDRMNRLTEVLTSRDAEVHKSREAHYRYFDYGPLSRVEIGQHKVQGNDYTYTIQGWLKAINGSTLNRSRDGGKDGANGYLANNPSVNSEFAPDLAGFTMGYYLNDYKSIGATSFLAATGNSGNAAVNAVATKQLYNGNIAYTTTAIDGFLNSATVYTYDQLNRLKASKMYGLGSVDNLNSWAASAAWTAYETAYTYDENGNMTTLMRNGNLGAAMLMDQFTYNYGSGSNRLTYVTDASINTTDYTTDIDNGQTGTTTAFGASNVIGAPSGNNYKYDKIGQLVEDIQEKYRYEWRSGDKKLKSQTPISTTGTQEQMEFVYNPLGQRILKIAKTFTNGVLQPNSGGTAYRYTYYAYDANGQVMATYSITNTSTIKQARVDEHSIYGASRLGLIQEEPTVYIFNNQAALPTEGPVWTNKLGKKNYELTNHLGNVNVVISDRKMVDDNFAAGVEYDFTIAPAPTFTATISTPTYTVTGGQLVVATPTAVATTITRSEATVIGQTYTFTVDVDRSGITGFDVNVYTSTTSTGGTLLQAYNNVGNGTISYTFTATQGFFRYEFKKTSTEIGNFKLDNLRLVKNNAKYKAVVLMKADYYPFGMQMEGTARKFVAAGFGGYRFGYNGMEKDPEMKGDGNSYTTEFRQYDPRLGRWASLDPLMMMFPWQSPYCAFDNNPVFYTDPYGLSATNKDGAGGDGGDLGNEGCESNDGAVVGQSTGGSDLVSSRTSDRPKPKEYSWFTKAWNFLGGNKYKNEANAKAVEVGQHAQSVFEGGIYIVLEPKTKSGTAFIDETLADDGIEVSKIVIQTKEDFLYEQITKLLDDEPTISSLFGGVVHEEIFDGNGNSYVVSVTYEQPVQITQSRIRIRFRSGTKNGVYGRMRSRRTGKPLPYIGKSFNISTRYAAYDRLKSGLRTIVSNVKDKNLLRAIEQRMQDYLSVEKGVPIDNMRRAMNLKDYIKYKDEMDELLKAFDWKGALDELFGL